MFIRTLRPLFAAFSLFLALAAPVHAQYVDLGENDSSPKVKAQLIAEQESIQPGKPFWVALKMDIIPDWHVYWRNPGDSGMATRIRWDLPQGFQAGEIVWPTPQRIAIPPLLNYGYSDQVLLLTQITPPAVPADPGITIKGKADWLVCHEVCIPESAEFSLDLPVAEQEPATSAWGSAFNATRRHVPKEFTGTVKATKKDDQNFILTITDLPLPAMDIPVEAYFFSGDPTLVSHSGEQQFSQNDRDIVMTVPFNTSSSDHNKPFDGDIWVRTTQGDYSFAIKAQFETPVPAAAVAAQQPAVALQSGPAPMSAPTSFGWLGALGLAFLGGILLNLMPCVFPVLSIKALSLVQKSQSESRSHVVMGGLVYVLGVLCTFLLLGAVLLILQAGGQTIGWGMQLQSPVFITVLILVLFLIGYSLIGAVTFGNRLMGIGQTLTHKSGFTGVFFTGALAVIVATPCTAPFMGGAMFYAFTQPWYVAFTVLIALGLGLALPYLLLCIFPRALSILPKPGIWMEHFKQFLAFPMFAASIWLVWVLAQQSGADGVLRALIAVLMLAFTLWVWHSVSHDTKKNAWHYTKIAIAVLTALYTLCLIYDQRMSAVPAEGAIKASALPYEKYSADTLVSLREQNRPVFVNMTAAWCITCLANEKNALSSQKVRDYFAQNNIAYLKGDWTNQDPAISEFLKQHQRNGVPLYVFYAPGAQPKILPQLLTPDSVIKELALPTVQQ